MIVGALSPEQIEAHWPHLSPRFKNFEQRTHGDVTADVLKEDCQTGRRQCWVALDDAIRAVALTEVVGLNNRVWLEYCAGEGRADWQSEIVSAIEDWARKEGSPGVVTFNRPGWVPFLKGKGYRETHRIMEKVF